MRVVVGALGVLLLLLAGSLTAVGVHDGVLGATDLETRPAPGDPTPVTVRATVLGPPMAAEEVLAALDAAQAVLVPAALRDHVASGGLLVPVAVDGVALQGPLPVLARLPAEAEPPADGARLVLRGDLVLHYVLVETGRALPETAPVWLVEPKSVHSPILFA